MKIPKCGLLLAFIVILVAPLIGQDQSKAEEPKAGQNKQPVLILLHSRFEDHINTGVGEDRVFRLLNLIENLKKEYPSQNVNVSCEFSGTVVQEMAKTPTGLQYLDRLKKLAREGQIHIGYIGENEPTYRNRVKPLLKSTMTPEQRWLEQTNVADHFLNDYKDPLTGEPDPNRAGGFRAVKEILGTPSILGVFSTQLGAEAPYFHQLLRMQVSALVPGFPDPYYTMNIHGYRVALKRIAVEALVPTPQASSEMFWDSNFLRLSFTSSDDIRRVFAEEGKDAVSKLLEKLDRSRVRILQIEVVGYSRYLDKWPDGTPKLFPLIWAYDHPEDPIIPNGIHAFLSTAPVQKSFASEEEALHWLFGEFLPANPGSRIVSPEDLMKMARTPLNTEVTADVLQDAAKDWLARTAKETNTSATFVESHGNYYSAADLFQLLANALAGVSKTGKRPDKVRLTHIYGPLTLEETHTTFPTTTVSAREVARVAAELAPRLDDQTWRPVPLNAVPVRVDIAGEHLLPAQFLAMMVDAYLAPSLDTTVKVRYFQGLTAPGYLFPRQNALVDAGHVWTLRPAVLQLNPNN